MLAIDRPVLAVPYTARNETVILQQKIRQNYRIISKSRGSTKLNTLNKCVICQREFQSFYSLQLHRRKIHQVNLNVGSLKTTRVQEITVELNEDSEKLKEKLEACQHLLVEVHAEHGRQEVFNFSLSKLDTNKINKKLDEIFENFKCAAKVNLALGFLLQIVENNDYHYYYPHENNLLHGSFSGSNPNN